MAGETYNGEITLSEIGDPVPLVSGIDTRYGREVPHFAKHLVLHAPTGNSGLIVFGGRWVVAATNSGRVMAANTNVHLENVCLEDLWLDTATDGNTVGFWFTPGEVVIGDTREII